MNLDTPYFSSLPRMITDWYQTHKRDLPWRHDPGPYQVWVSEIMLQQTRVETVIAYYERFLNKLPAVRDLSEADEDTLLKLWEGLGYYSRVRNMQTAARQIMTDYQGEFPRTYADIRSLKGIGSYTAGAICAFAYGLPQPAVDGNVLRVISRLTGSKADIARQSTKKAVEDALMPIIPTDAAADFDQGLIELGALVCVPNGQPKCSCCPLCSLCTAYQEQIWDQLPVKTAAKARRIEPCTILLFRDPQHIAIRKRPPRGLLAGLYEFPGLEGHLNETEVISYCKSIGLMPVRIRRLDDARHVFSHVEWQMWGYEILVDELEQTNAGELLFVDPKEISKTYPIPSAFRAYLPFAGIQR